MMDYDADNAVNASVDDDATDDCDQAMFSPPLYRQRYELAASILQEAKVTSVILNCF